MPSYEIVEATAEHVAALAADMREADVAEAWAAARLSPLAALQLSVAASREPKSGLADGRVMCMFGVAGTILGGSAVPWMLGHRELPQHVKPFLRMSREYARQIMREYDRLFNFVDARNALAIRWLKWLGFRIEDAKPFGPDQILFHRFEAGHGCRY